MMKRFSLILLLPMLLILILWATSAPLHFLLFGLEGQRTDTILLVSMDPPDPKIQILSIPRDTYNPVEGKNGLGQKKINAVYGFREGGGPEGLKSAVEGLTGITIDGTIALHYEHVERLVDLMGGIPTEVPYTMHYDDPWATPPLSIHFEAGRQVITGDQALNYLRFRKNNDGSKNMGDLGRIERQQAFLRDALIQAKNSFAPALFLQALSIVEADLPLKSIFCTLPLSLQIKADDAVLITLPVKHVGKGDDGLSYFFHDPQATQELFEHFEKAQ